MPDGPRQLRGGRHGLSRQDVLRSQRDRLLTASIAATVEKGFDAMTVADIIRHAGVSRRTFYELFTDKEDAFLAAYDGAIETLVREMERAHREHEGDWPGRIRAGLGAAAELLASNAAIAHVTMVEATAARPIIRRRYREALTRFTPFLDEGRGYSEYASRLPANTSRIAVGNVAALIFDTVYAGRAELMRDVLPDLVYVAILPFVGRDVAIAEREATIAAQGGNR